ncbi:unnamed protein product [Blepharisma stoltei]|uniref:Uncharacterized protein n=1 Tax=Blepharisma stoltei TaxID=1481888 RepID=A0AAU9IUZ8_9CILI|nr:unnamed protein product [Blepharisma stoltei]
MDESLIEIETQIKLGNLSYGIDLLQLLVNKCKRSPEELSHVAENIYRIGQELLRKQDFKNIIGLWKYLALIFSACRQYDRVCDVKNSISYCLRMCRRIPESIKELQSAIETATSMESAKHKLPGLHLNACAIFRENLKDLKSALVHAELAFFHAKQALELSNIDISSIKHTLGVSYYNIGLIKEDMDDLSSSLLWLKEGLKFCEENVNDLFLEQTFREKILCIESRPHFLPLQIRSRSNTPALPVRPATKKNLRKYSFLKMIDRSSTKRGIKSRRSNRGKSVSYANMSLDHRMSKYYVPSFSPEVKNTQKDNLSNFSPNPDSYSSFDKSTEVSVKSSKINYFSVKNDKVIKLKSARRHLSHPTAGPFIPSDFGKQYKAAIKIQCWYRAQRCRKKYLIERRHYDYIGFCKITSQGGFFFCSVYRNIKQAQLKHRFMRKKIEVNIVVDAYPLTKGLKKPKNFSESLSSLCKRIDIPSDEAELRKKENALFEIISIVDSKIELCSNMSNRDCTTIRIIYEGKIELNEVEYFIEIFYVPGDDKFLDIKVMKGESTYTCRFQLDVLQDFDTVRTKIPYLISKLKLENEILELKM